MHHYILLSWRNLYNKKGDIAIQSDVVTFVLEFWFLTLVVIANMGKSRKVELKGDANL